MPSIAPTTSHVPQTQTAPANGQAPNNSTPSATIALVVDAANTDNEKSAVEQAIAALDAKRVELEAAKASLQAAFFTDQPNTEQRELYYRASQLATQLNTMSKAIEQLPQLVRERNTLQSQLNDGGLGWSEKTQIGMRLGQVNYDLKFAMYQARTGGDFHEFCEFQHGPDLRREAGTLRSRLADGGLSAEDQQKIQDRLEYLEQSLISVENNIAAGQEARARARAALL